MKKRLICLLIGMLVGMSWSCATILESFQYQWLIYDTDLATFVPFLHEEHRNFYRRHLFIAPENYPDAYFEVYADKGAYLFINNKLYGTFTDSGYLSIPNRRIIDLSADKKLTLITVHHVQLPSVVTPRALFRLPATPLFTELIKPDLASVSDAVSDTAFQIKFPEKRSNSFLFIFPFGILMFLALGNVARNYFFNIRAFMRYLELFFRYRTDVRKVDVGSLLFYLIFYGMSLSYIMVYLTDTSQYSYWYIGSYIMAFLSIKIVLMNILGYLHNHDHLAVVHLQETLFISILVGVLFLLLGLLGYAHPLIFDNTLLRYGILFLLFFQMFLIIFKVNRLLDIKKLYLISYFCGTELLPTVIFIKSFVK